MNLGPSELIIIVLIIVLLFGAKRLPDVARSLGRSMRIFKSEVHEMNNDSTTPVNGAAQPQAITPPQPTQAPQVTQPQPGTTDTTGR